MFKHRFGNRILAIILCVTMCASFLNGCGKKEKKIHGDDQGNINIDVDDIVAAITSEINQEITKAPQRPNDMPLQDNHEKAEAVDSDINIDFFVYEKMFDEYSLAYDTFDAVVTLSDGTEVYGIGYSDFANYLEPVDGTKGFFTAGFLIGGGDIEIPEEEIEKGLEIVSLDYQDDRYGFVLAYETEPYLKHFILDGKYVKYGIDEEGKVIYEECNFSKDVCDTSLGSLYSYDEGRYIYEPNVGGYVTITGTSLYRQIDYKALEAEVNKILSEQDVNFSAIDLESSIHYAKEAVDSYLLSIQEETFLGCHVEELIEAVSKLDPKQCIRITPDGHVIIDIDDEIPKESDALAKWVVGVSCGIAIIGSVALEIFVPVTSPAAGAIIGAAVDVFMQVVIENHSVENINWSKVAVAATSGAIMSWACPLGAATVAKSVAAKTGKEVLGKLAGYGFLTISNAIVSGATNASFSAIDGENKSEIFDAFVMGAALGAACTAAASALSEGARAAVEALAKTHPENWFTKLSEGTSKFIGEHQVRLVKSDAVYDILSPKSVYEASKSGVAEYKRQVIEQAVQAHKQGGGYKEVKAFSDGKYTEVHEIPSNYSLGTGNREVDNLPSVKMSVEDHRQTASWGNSKEAQLYRKTQKELISQNKIREAIQMDIDDLTMKFGNKYKEGIELAIEHAIKMGWW